MTIPAFNNAAMPRRSCAWCGCEFQLRRRNMRYCSTYCRSMHFYEVVRSPVTGTRPVDPRPPKEPAPLARRLHSTAEARRKAHAAAQELAEAIAALKATDPRLDEQDIRERLCVASGSRWHRALQVAGIRSGNSRGGRGAGRWG